MRHGLTYYGTDGNGSWLERWGFELWQDEVGSVICYRGKYPNYRHDPVHRKAYHEPLFRRETQKRDSAFLAEWWLVGHEERRLASASLAGGSGFLTYVHIRKVDLDLAAKLRRLRSRGLGSSIHLLSDLPQSSLPHEVLIETVLPSEMLAYRIPTIRRGAMAEALDDLQPRGRPHWTGVWIGAANDATSVVEVLAGVE